MSPTIAVDLTLTDCEVIVVALADLRTVRGEPGWDAPAVANLRRKIADAIAAQAPGTVAP